MEIRTGEWTADLQSYGLQALLCNLLLAMTLLFAGPSARAETLVVAFGDSLVQGYGLSSADSVPVRLEAALKAHGISDARVVNAGVSGDTSADGLARLDWTFPPNGLKPALAIVEFGANDMLRGLDPAAAEANLDKILGSLDKRNIPVLLAGMMAAPNLGSDYRTTFNRIYPDLAARWKVALYPFFLDGVAAEPAKLQSDGMHPNRQGVETIVNGLLPDVLKLLKAPPLGNAREKM